MARILIVSKFRKFQGGVERHIYDLIDGLKSRGHDVKFFTSEDVEAAGGAVFSASSTGIKRVQSARALLWNAQARSLMRHVVDEFRPDVVHYHTISHQLSPAVLGSVRVPTVMTLHEYKLSAPCYTLYRDGEVCEACVGRRFALPAIRFKCISGSAAASALCATEGLLHRNRYRSEVCRFVVPSQFAFNVAVASGLPESRISIIPWGVAAAGEPSKRKSKVAFFGGRLHRTKGIEALVRAWQTLPTGHGCFLRIAGEGECEQLVKDAASFDPTVQFLGMLPAETLMEEVKGAAVAIVPSLFPETMGLSALEALNAGTPIVSSGRGALADLSGPGVWTLQKVESPDLRAALVSLLIEGRSELFQRELSTRDLSRYSLDKMIDAIEAEYLRTSHEYWSSERGAQ